MGHDLLASLDTGSEAVETQASTAGSMGYPHQTHELNMLCLGIGYFWFVKTFDKFYKLSQAL